MASLSYQLYSSRNFDMDEILSTLEKHGVREVEGYGPLFENPQATQEKLASFGLSMPTAHMSLDLVEGDPERTLAIAKALNIQAVIVPHIMPDLRPKTAAGWAEFGKRLAAAGKPIVDAGLKFGWHNHDFEFKAYEDGSFPIEHIARGADYIDLELDLAWIHVGGQDPIKWLDTFGDRVIAVHIKDRAAAGENSAEDGWADVGHGVMDWAAISAKLRAMGVARYVLEHDNPSDHIRFATRSIATAQTL